MITRRAGTGRTGTDYYLESWDRQDRYRLLLGELGQAGRLQMITWRAGTGRTVTDDYQESWDRQDGYR
jgi:hypothetical protein